MVLALRYLIFILIIDEEWEVHAYGATVEISKSKDL